MTELAGLLGFCAVLLLAFLRVPVAVAMGVVGVLGAIPLSGWDSVRYVLGTAPFDAVYPYGLSVVPLFIFMGVFASRSGLSRNLYEGVHAWMGSWRGGMAMATIGACAGFGTICGSSLATCATMAKVALPEMRRHGYDDSLATGSVAAGGTLGILFPPSIMLIIYGLLTQQSIGALFAAGLLPGVVAMTLYMLAIRVKVWRDPRSGPAGPSLPLRARVRALARVWDVVLLFVVVIGGIYSGMFSPSEAAAIGAAGALAFAVFRGQFSVRALVEGLQQTAIVTGMIFMILIGAALFNFFVESSNLPQFFIGVIQGSGLSPMAILVLVLLFYLGLGCVMDSLSMVLLTVPTLFPVITHLGFDPIWFGIIVVTIVEVGLITPPIGMNLFIINGSDPSIRQSTVVRGVVPFVVADVARLALLVAFPAIALWLPHSLGML